MSYASIHKSNERFELTVTLVLLLAAFITIAFMFIHPSIALLVFWAGMMIAASAAIVEAVIRRRERAEIRRHIAARSCPQCDGRLEPSRFDSEIWCCDQCEARFAAKGDVLAAGA